MEAVKTPAATILVVDDEAPIRTLAAQVLGGRGYHVLLGADSSEALRVSDSYGSVIHLLLTDIMLGSGNGVALAQAVLVKRPETAVIYMSDFYADALQAVQSERGPGGGFLEKPFTARSLIDGVRAVVPLPDTQPEKVDRAEGRIQTRMNPRESPILAVSNEPAQASPRLEHSEAAYRLESPVRCPHCGEVLSTLKAVRLLRTEVNFTSTLPRRGRVIVCPFCVAIVPAELTNF